MKEKIKLKWQIFIKKIKNQPITLFILGSSDSGPTTLSLNIIYKRLFPYINKNFLVNH